VSGRESVGECAHGSSLRLERDEEPANQYQQAEGTAVAKIWVHVHRIARRTMWPLFWNVFLES
jgi:hypothetical protein